MRLKHHEIHIWTADLSLQQSEENTQLALLGKEEVDRANRLRTPLHRQRFIAARSTLRQLIAFYLTLPPKELSFAYSKNGKPYLADKAQGSLQFNLAHSHDLAVYAFALDEPVGIDIEKIKAADHSEVVQRFFSDKEKMHFHELSTKDKTLAFYRLWTRKEAVIKASGKGIALSLNTFSVSAQDIAETVTLDNQTSLLLPLSIHRDYQAALACHTDVKILYFWQFFNQGTYLDKRYNLSSL